MNVLDHVLRHFLCSVLKREEREIMGYRETFFAHNKGTKLPLKRGTYYRCVGCGNWFTKSEITVDHKISKRYGGTDDISNLQPMCRSCNSSKRERSTGMDVASSVIGATLDGSLGQLAGSVAQQKIKDALGIKYKRK